MLAIIILNYNNSKDTIECLKSICNLEYKEYRVFLGDNSTNIDEYEKVKDFIKLNSKIKDKIELIRINENKGFGSGNNSILKEINLNEYDDILLLNNDTILIDNKLINKIYDKVNLINNDKYIIGVKLLNNDRTLQDSKGDFPGIINELIYSLRLKKIINKEKFDYLCGAFLFFNTNFIKEVGYFDEDYFMYFEEVDLLFRAQKKGYKLYYLDNTEVIHKGGQSTGKLNDFTVENYNKSINLFMKKNLNYKLRKYIFWLIRSLLYIINIVILSILGLIKGKDRYSNRVEWCNKNLKKSTILLR